MKKRILTSLLALCMLLTLLPTVALADTGEVSTADALTSAISNASGATTIKLGADIAASITIASGQNITLDLNGHKLVDSDQARPKETTGINHTITNNGKLTITDSSSGGTVDNVSHGAAAIMNNNGAECTILAGTFTRSEEKGTSSTDNGGNSYYTINNYGKMTFGTEGGTNEITVTANGHYSSLVHNGWQNSSDAQSKKAEMTIYGGAFTGGINTIKNDESGTLTINGGTFNNVTQYAVQNWNVATINDGTFESDTMAAIYNGAETAGTSDGQLTINGGDFTAPSNYYVVYNDKNSNSNASASTKIGGGTYSSKYVGNSSVTYEEGYSVVVGEETVTVRTVDEDEKQSMAQDSEGRYYEKDATAEANNVAKIVTENGTTYYGSLSAALAAVTDGDTVTLLKNVNSDITLSSGKKFTIDLGGKTLTGTITITHGNLTVKNGTILKENGQAINVCGSTESASQYSVLNIENDATVTGEWGICLFPASGSTSGYGAEINIAGTVNGVVFVSGNLGNDTNSASAMAKENVSTINVKSGATIVSAAPAQGIAMNGYAVVNVEDGASITGGEAIGVKRGVLNVTGGTFVATGEKKDPAMANTNGTEQTGAAISVTSTYNYAGTIGVNISGGTFTSTNNAALYVGHSAKDGTATTYTNGVSVDINGGDFIAPENESAVYVADSINGDADDYTQRIVSSGNFSKSVDPKYLDKSLTAELVKANSDTPYSYYTDVSKALAAAQPGDKVNDLSTPSDGETGTKFTVTLNYNDGGSADVTVEVKSGETVTLPKPTRSGYTFRYWSDASGNTYEAGNTVTITADTTFTAQWTPVYTGSSTSGNSVTVTKPSNGTVTATPSSAGKGTTVTLTVKADAGYVLSDLTVVDANGNVIALTDKGNGKYTFTMPATKVTVSAVFAEDCPSEQFIDVDTAAWYHEAVDYAVANGLMAGTSTNTFGPNDTTTRGMIVTILYRLEGQPAAGTSGFSDVADGQYYAKAVAWAAANNIVAGFEDGTFGPNQAITREQFAAILYRYAQYKGLNAVTLEENLAQFTDAGRISGYAVQSMNWAVGKGILSGKGNGILDPQGPATRAEAAQILMTFCENVAG